jgi:hypothetical protein
MRRAERLLVLLVVGMLTACASGSAPTVSRIDGPAIQRSLLRMAESLPEAERAAFDVALTEISIAKCPGVRQALCDGVTPPPRDWRCLGRVLGGQSAPEVLKLAGLIDPKAACSDLAQPTTTH